MGDYSMDVADSIEMVDYTKKTHASSPLIDDGDETRDSFDLSSPTKGDDTLKHFDLLVQQQRTNFKLYSNFIVIFILGCVMLFYNLTATFSCTGDSITSCYPQFTLQVQNNTPRARLIIGTAQECLKMVSFFSTSFLSPGDSNDNSDLLAPLLDLGGLGNSTVDSTAPPSTANGGYAEDIDVAELERLKTILDLLKQNGDSLDLTNLGNGKRDVLGGLDLEVVANENKDDSSSHSLSESSAIDLLHLLDLLNDAQDGKNSTQSSDSAEPTLDSDISEHVDDPVSAPTDMSGEDSNKTESALLHFMSGIMGNIDDVLESKGLLNVIDTLSENNYFQLNHNGYCRVNKHEKTSYCTYSHGLDVFAVLVQDIGLQLANLTKANDSLQLTNSIMQSYYNAVSTFTRLYKKASTKENKSKYSHLDLEKLVYAKSLNDTKGFALFSSRVSFLIIIISIISTILIGNTLLSFTVENVKFFRWIQINLGRYVVKALLGLIGIKILLEGVVLIGELHMLRKYRGVFNSLEVASFRPTWGFFFTVLNFGFSGIQLYLLYSLKQKHVKL